MGQATILLVEDDLDVSEHLATALRESGYKCRAITDGGMALYAIRSESFDYIVLDIKLPSMSGLQIASIVRSSDKNKTTPISIVSGYLNDENIRRIRQLGISHIVEKPFEFQKLIDHIQQSLTAPKETDKGYDARLINAFLTATQETFAHYLKVGWQVQKATVRKNDAPAFGLITGLLSFAGSGFVGSMSLSVNGHLVKELANSLFPESEVQLDQRMAADIVGEICNQLLGGVKRKLAELGVRMNLGLPELVMGKEHIIIHKVTNPVICFPIKIGDKVSAVLEFCMDKRDLQVDEEQKDEHIEAGGALLFD